MIPGYKIEEEIYRGRKRILYRGKREQNSMPVIIKTLIADFPAEKDIASLKHEYEILQNLDIHGIAKAYSLEREHNRPALILEDVGGKTLRALIDSQDIDLLKFLKIAIQLSGIIAELDRKSVV